MQTPKNHLKPKNALPLIKDIRRYGYALYHGRVVKTLYDIGVVKTILDLPKASPKEKQDLLSRLSKPNGADRSTALLEGSLAELEKQKTTLQKELTLYKQTLARIANAPVNTRQTRQQLVYIVTDMKLAALTALQ